MLSTKQIGIKLYLTLIVMATTYTSELKNDPYYASRTTFTKTKQHSSISEFPKLVLNNTRSTLKLQSNPQHNYNYSSDRLSTDIYSNFNKIRSVIFKNKKEKLKELDSLHYHHLTEKANKFYLTEKLSKGKENNKVIISRLNTLEKEEGEKEYDDKCSSMSEGNDSSNGNHLIKKIRQVNLNASSFQVQPFLKPEVLRKQYFSSSLAGHEHLVVKESISKFLEKTKEIRLRKFANIHKLERKNRIKETFENNKDSAKDTIINLNISKITFYDQFIVNFEKYCRKVKIQKEIELKRLYKLKQNKQVIDIQIKQIEMKRLKLKEYIEKCLEYRNFLLSVKTRNLNHFKNNSIKIIIEPPDLVTNSSHTKISNPIVANPKAKLAEKSKNNSVNNINSRIIKVLEPKEVPNQRKLLTRRMTINEELYKPHETIFSNVNELISHLTGIENESLKYLEKYNSNRALINHLHSSIKLKHNEDKSIEKESKTHMNHIISVLSSEKSRNAYLKREKERLIKKTKFEESFQNMREILEKMIERLLVLNIIKVEKKEAQNIISLSLYLSYLEKGLDYLLQKSVTYQKLDPDKFKGLIRHLEIEHRGEKTRMMQQENINKRKRIVIKIISKFSKRNVIPLRKIGFKVKPKEKNCGVNNNNFSLTSKIEDYLFSDS